MSSSEALIRQLRAMREGVALYDASRYGQLAIEGADAASFLQRMTANEVQRLTIGEGRYNAILDRKGMISSLFYLLRTGESEFLASLPPQLTEKTFSFLTKMKFIQKVTVKDLSREMGLLFFIGPEAESFVKTALSPGDTGVLWKEETFGLPVWNLSARKEEVTRILEEASTKIPRAEEEALRLLRMSVGFPEYGIDVDEGHILLEIRVPVAYQRQKGCYPGQEVIERILAYGKGRTPQTLCTLFLEGVHSVSAGTEIVAPSREKAGKVTSALYNPLDRKTVVLAYVEHKFVEGASMLRIERGLLVIA